MSDDPQSAMERSYFPEQRDETPLARVPRQPRDQYVSLFMGSQRAPRLADEVGAICVIELLFGGRAIFYAIDGDAKHRRVERREP